MASGWGDILPSLITSIFDKAILGGVLVGVGYWFQKRLELFKRDQSLASELAKARIAAYHRGFAAASSVDYVGGRVLHRAAELTAEDPGWGKKTADEKSSDTALASALSEYLEELKKLFSLLATERHLVGDSFCRAVVHFVDRQKEDLVEAMEKGLPSEEERRRRRAEHTRLREAIALCLPPFARAPAEDLHFSNPNVDETYKALTGRDLRDLWSARQAAQSAPKKGEAP